MEACRDPAGNRTRDLQRERLASVPLDYRAVSSGCGESDPVSKLGRLAPRRAAPAGLIVWLQESNLALQQRPTKAPRRSLAPRAGLAPASSRLTAARSTLELPGNGCCSNYRAPAESRTRACRVRAGRAAITLQGLVERVMGVEPTERGVALLVASDAHPQLPWSTRPRPVRSDFIVRRSRASAPARPQGRHVVVELLGVAPSRTRFQTAAPTPGSELVGLRHMPITCSGERLGALDHLAAVDRRGYLRGSGWSCTSARSSKSRLLWLLSYGPVVALRGIEPRPRGLQPRAHTKYARGAMSRASRRSRSSSSTIQFSSSSGPWARTTFFGSRVRRTARCTSPEWWERRDLNSRASVLQTWLLPGSLPGTTKGAADFSGRPRRQ